EGWHAGLRAGARNVHVHAAGRFHSRGCQVKNTNQSNAMNSYRIPSLAAAILLPILTSCSTDNSMTQGRPSVKNFMTGEEPDYDVRAGTQMRQEAREETDNARRQAMVRTRTAQPLGDVPLLYPYDLAMAGTEGSATLDYDVDGAGLVH